MRSKSPNLWLLVLPLVAALGCAEETLVRTSPAAARLYYRGRFVGVTPTPLVVPHSDLQTPVVVRVEHEGYQPQDVQVPTEIGGGRVTGAIFTLGISFLWKPPTTLADEVEIALVPLASAPAAEAAPVAPAVAPKANLEQRLQRLKDLYDGGLITEQEYRRRRTAMLEGL